jgi:hypothetical protein
LENPNFEGNHLGLRLKISLAFLNDVEIIQRKGRMSITAVTRMMNVKMICFRLSLLDSDAIA